MCILVILVLGGRERERVGVCVRCVHVCMCVSESERQADRQTDKETDRESVWLRFV